MNDDALNSRSDPQETLFSYSRTSQCSLNVTTPCACVLLTHSFLSPRVYQGRRHGFRPGWAKIFGENSARSAEKIFLICPPWFSVCPPWI